MFSSLRFQLSVSHLGVIVLAMGLSAFILLSFLENYLLDATEDSLLVQAQITAQALIPEVVISEEEDIDTTTQINPPSVSNAIQNQQISSLYLQASNISPEVDELPVGEMDLAYLSYADLQLGSQLNTRIRIVDTGGMVLVDSQQEQQNVDLTGDPLLSRAMTGEIPAVVDNDEGIMHLAYPAIVGDHIVGIIYLSQSLQDVMVVLHDVQNRFLISAGIALLVTGIIAIILSRALSNPLRRLTAAAEAVGEGRFDQEVPVHSQNEIGRLSKTFNDMVVRLKKSHQTQLDFIANVSHELRTPLTSIKGIIETLQSGAAEDDKVRERFLSIAETGTDRLIRLVNDLMLLSQADSAALELQRKSVTIELPVKAAVKQLSPLADAKNLIMKIDISPDTPPVWIDTDRIEQVIVNLVDNAIKYSRPEGTVTVSASPERDNYVAVIIRDEGIGISADDLSRVGQRFFRADKARSRANGGSGLGLAIARSLIEAHNGRLLIESQEGQGTTVSFTLPSS
jgi:signal transduction histidine kinase